MTPRVPNEPRTWREWRERFPEMAGQHAMHEAAHAVAAWFLGDWDLVQISMQPNRKSVARNRRRCFIRPVPIAADAAALKRQWAKYEYAREAIIFLAGPYSDGATEPSDSHWLELAIEISDDFDAMDHWGGYSYRTNGFGLSEIAFGIRRHHRRDTVRLLPFSAQPPPCVAMVGYGGQVD